MAAVPRAGVYPLERKPSVRGRGEKYIHVLYVWESTTLLLTVVYRHQFFGVKALPLGSKKRKRAQRALH